ncbi:hypothetical protein BUALT_BualtUnG0057500 [Buddleja alternifolia]|uniref:Cyclin N-terminal domain-containing protein n=1 Tax=Buddleja alternifolia TaxID=168488 RepID=A0AAV6W6P9_9LAMI|nr:hypothetical protein BUALT_BualtUnG0057500 [Buddleja alternifolia]
MQDEGQAHDNMDSQPVMNEKMRGILIDWLFQVHHKFELPPVTVYLTINILNGYLASKITLSKELQFRGSHDIEGVREYAPNGFLHGILHGIEGPLDTDRLFRIERGYAIDDDDVCREFCTPPVAEQPLL